MAKNIDKYLLAWGCLVIMLALPAASVAQTTETAPIDATVSISGGALVFSCDTPLDFGDVTIQPEFGTSDVFYQVADDGSTFIFDNQGQSSSDITVSAGSASNGVCTLAGLDPATTEADVTITQQNPPGNAASMAGDPNGTQPSSDAPLTVQNEGPGASHINIGTIVNGSLDIAIGGTLKIPQGFNAVNDGDYIGTMEFQAEISAP